MTREAKQIIIIRKDLKMRRGKEIAQGAHASMAVILDMLMRAPDPDWALIKPKIITSTMSYVEGSATDSWINGSFKKITVTVDSLDDLMRLCDQAKIARLPHAIITDSGLTEFNNVPTVTAAAIGPAWSDELQPITGHLKLY